MAVRPPRGFRDTAALPLLLALVSTANPDLHAAERYDPRLGFRQVRTEHFTIYFHQGEEDLARRLASIAEDVHARLVDRLDLEGERRHTRVILVDQHDDANGWATPLPYNLIEVSAAAPSPSSLIGYTDDWLRLVFTHEYSHILHLDRSRGLFRVLRLVLGRSPIAFPNVYLPGWSTEGLATAVETTATDRGRLASGEFRTIVDAAARAGRFAPLDRASGGLVDWPGGHATYAYGARFHEFLIDRYGAEKVAAAARATAGRLPFAEAGGYERAFGVKLTELWREFEQAVERETSEGSNSQSGVERMTSHGFVVTSPRWTPDGSHIVYSLRTPHGFPALMQVPAPGGEPEHLAERFLGERASVGETHVLFDQQEFVRSVGLRHDLYLLDLRSGDVGRLTRDGRVRDADVRWGDGSVVAVSLENGRADLVRYALERTTDGFRLTGPDVLAREPETQHAAPRWSPDGRAIAVERRRLGRAPEVVVLEASTGRLLHRIMAPEGRVGEPEWTRDGQSVIVSWERPRQPFNLYRVNLQSGDVHALVRLSNGARSAALSPDGTRLAFVGYTTEGYDLFTAPVVATPVSGDGPRLASEDPPNRESNALPELPTADYSPLPTLLPRFWMPVVNTDEERLEAGATTGGFDALGRHAYAIVATWSDRARPDWAAFYVYDRWRPSFFLSASDDVERWQGSGFRESTVEAGVTTRFRTVRRTQTLFGAFHATRQEDPAGVFQRRSIRVGYQLSTARRYGYSIGPEEGVSVGGALDLTRRTLGADGDAVTATVDVRAYPGLGGPHRVLAIRAAAGGSWGDAEARRILGAGGSAAPGSAIAFGRSAIGLARGFETDEISGDRAVVFNVDYRLPLLRVERGYRTWPIMLRQFHAAVFADAAHAWRDRFAWRDARVSAGVELSADIVLGHYLPLTLAAGVAARRDPAGDRPGPAAFARVGYAF